MAYYMNCQNPTCNAAFPYPKLRIKYCSRCSAVARPCPGCPRVFRHARNDHCPACQHELEMRNTLQHERPTGRDDFQGVAQEYTFDLPENPQGAAPAGNDYYYTNGPFPCSAAPLPLGANPHMSSFGMQDDGQPFRMQGAGYPWSPMATTGADPHQGVQAWPLPNSLEPDASSPMEDSYGGFKLELETEQVPTGSPTCHTAAAPTYQTTASPTYHTTSAGPLSASPTTALPGAYYGPGGTLIPGSPYDPSWSHSSTAAPPATLETVPVYGFAEDGQPPARERRSRTRETGGKKHHSKSKTSQAEPRHGRE